MEIHEDTPSQTQISIEFPLGLSLLVALLFFICCFFCCCLHWDKLQSFFPSSWIISNDNINPQDHIQAEFNFTSSHHKPGFPVLMMQQNHVQRLPVLMPGDEVPKFIAMECPCKPPIDENITIHVQKTPPSGFCSAI